AAPDILEHVVHDVERMHAHQRRRSAGKVALHDRDVLGAVDRALVDDDIEIALLRPSQHRLHRAYDDAVLAQAVGDEIGDGADLEPVQLGEPDEVGQPRHGAVIVHDLADHAGGVEPGQPGQVDG